jgi:hypothetical protein
VPQTAASEDAVDLFTLLEENDGREPPPIPEESRNIRNPLMKQQFDPALIKELKYRVLAFDLALLVDHNGPDGSLQATSATFHEQFQELTEELERAFGPDWEQSTHVVLAEFGSPMDREVDSLKEAVGRVLPALRGDKIRMLGVVDAWDLARQLKAHYPDASGKTLVLSDQHIRPPGRSSLNAFSQHHQPMQVIVVDSPAEKDEVLPSGQSVRLAVKVAAQPDSTPSDAEWTRSIRESSRLDPFTRSGVVELKPMPVTPDMAFREQIDREHLTRQLTGRQAKAFRRVFTAA